MQTNSNENINITPLFTNMQQSIIYIIYCTASIPDSIKTHIQKHTAPSLPPLIHRILAYPGNALNTTYLE